MNFSSINFDHTIRGNNNDERILKASVIVLVFVTSFIAMELVLNFLPNLLHYLKHPSLQNLKKENNQTLVYPVLVKQKEADHRKKNEIRALSDVNSSGKGGVTTKYGFHSLSKDDTLEEKKRTQRENKLKKDTLERKLNGDKVGNVGKKKNTNNNLQNKEAYRIPSNYRFRSDFLLRFDGSSLLSIPRQELAGFSYFRALVNKLRDNFAPPGVNFRYRDRGGLIINEPIQPQVVQVAFALDPEGNVSDVHVVSSLGDEKVDESCLNSLRNQNFGVPPSEIFEKGNVFGINFVFPSMQ